MFLKMLSLQLDDEVQRTQMTEMKYIRLFVSSRPWYQAEFSYIKRGLLKRRDRCRASCYM